MKLSLCAQNIFAVTVCGYNNNKMSTYMPMQCMYEYRQYTSAMTRETVNQQQQQQQPKQQPIAIKNNEIKIKPQLTANP